MKKTQREEIVRYEFKRNKNITADFIAEKYGVKFEQIQVLLNKIRLEHARETKKKTGKYIAERPHLMKPEYLEGVDIEADIKHVDVDKLYEDYMSGK